MACFARALIEFWADVRLPLIPATSSIRSYGGARDKQAWATFAVRRVNKCPTAFRSIRKNEKRRRLRASLLSQAGSKRDSID